MISKENFTGNGIYDQHNEQSLENLIQNIASQAPVTGKSSKKKTRLLTFYKLIPENWLTNQIAIKFMPLPKKKEKLINRTAGKG